MKPAKTTNKKFVIKGIHLQRIAKTHLGNHFRFLIVHNLQEKCMLKSLRKTTKTRFT